MPENTWDLNCTVAEIPAYLKDRPRWSGFPIPFTTLIKPDGSPDFRVTDQQQWAKCVTRGLCGLCGQALVYWQAFIGGEKCKETHLFFDPAMHIECAEFAAKACPFIVGIKGYSIKTDRDATADRLISSERPKLMYLFKTRGYDLVKVDGKIYIKAQPFKFVTELPWIGKPK